MWLHVYSVYNARPQIYLSNMHGMPPLVILIGVATLPSSGKARTDTRIGNDYNVLLCFVPPFSPPAQSISAALPYLSRSE